jgi:oligoendopeptidase F
MSRSPLSDLVEFEFLASAVRAKRSGFETLREVAEVDHRVDKAELDRLIEQANRQYDWLTHTRRDVAAADFGGRPQAADESSED